MEARQFLEEGRGIAFRRIGKDDAFELVGAARGAFGWRFVADAGSFLQNGAGGDLESAGLFVHQAADHVQIQISKDHRVVEFHARAILFEVLKLLR